ncbi:MAG: proline--tRNA ligase [SAR116 cluster bacterium]|nr:proline--tRNA ligase [SAR116 cluster bacterium]
MFLSKYFLPIVKNTPKDAQIVSHRLMMRSGMIKQDAAGIYSWLPLGLKVLKKISSIIVEEQNNSGAHEMLMPTIQSADLWRESGRYDDYGLEMLRIKDRHERDILFGPTNEEMITDIFRTNIKSYRSLPLNLYQIQWKFRDEIRPRFGVMRGREFLMKDGYSFDIDKDTSYEAYNKMFISYLKIFNKLGLTAMPMEADTGPIGGDRSHEFIILAETGESKVFYDRKWKNLNIDIEKISYDENLQKIVDRYTSLYAATDEKHDPSKINKNDLLETRGIEVGHIFHFGTKYSESMGAKVVLPDGSLKPVFMGSYGIGVSRLVGAIIESSHDEAGIKWPIQVAPFDVAIVNLSVGNDSCDTIAHSIYNSLKSFGKDILYDDTKESAGSKLASMDLIGIPYQVIVGPRLAKDNKFEIKSRLTDETNIISFQQLYEFIK